MNRLKPYVKPGFTDCVALQTKDGILAGSGPGAAGGGDYPGVQKSRLFKDFNDDCFFDDEYEEEDE